MNESSKVCLSAWHIFVRLHIWLYKSFLLWREVYATAQRTSLILLLLLSEFDSELFSLVDPLKVQLHKGRQFPTRVTSQPLQRMYESNCRTVQVEVSSDGTLVSLGVFSLPISYDAIKERAIAKGALCFTICRVREKTFQTSQVSNL